MDNIINVGSQVLCEFDVNYIFILSTGQFLSQIQRYNEAASQYLEALKLAPTEYELALGAATAFRQAGHNQQAEQLYRQAVSMRPMVSWINFQLINPRA